MKYVLQILSVTIALLFVSQAAIAAPTFVQPSCLVEPDPVPWVPKK